VRTAGREVVLLESILVSVLYFLHLIKLYRSD
jgi:hypothetical protein